MQVEGAGQYERFPISQTGDLLWREDLVRDPPQRIEMLERMIGKLRHKLRNPGREDLDDGTQTFERMPKARLRF
jgi:hypothetical protein